MAALKRAQAHQRRGCPEQQQQPLLAVKVELEQLIISILDDPSVSRVMREASFSSPAVKATIEQSLSTSNAASANSSPIGLGFRSVPPPANRNLYINPRLQQGGAAQIGQQRSEEVKRVIDILQRTKKRNPVLVGDSEPELVMKEILRKIESKELGDGPLKNVQVIHLEKELSPDRTQMMAKIKELESSLESRIGKSDCGGAILYLGDLKWLVEQQVSFGVAGCGGLQQNHQQVLSDTGRAAVTEMGKLLVRFGDGGGGGGGRLWLIGTATCETYLRCQVYHPSMENDWDLQAVPIAPRAPQPGMFPRIGSGILSSSVESLSPLKNFPSVATAPSRRVSENVDPSRRMSCCSQCMQNYEQELAKFASKEFERSSSEAKSDAGRSQLPQWLQSAKANNGDVKTVDQTPDQELMWKQKTQELQKKWNETCLHLHPSHHQPSLASNRASPTVLSMTNSYNPNLVPRQPFQPKSQLNKNLGATLQLNSNLLTCQPTEKVSTPPGSPVRTDLVLGRPKVVESTPEKIHKERVKDFLGCIPSETQNKFDVLPSEKAACLLDADSYKRLLKGLSEKVSWQQDAASAVAAMVTQCRLGNGKRRGAASKGDIWILFMGPDRVGKKKMASALSELVCGANPTIISLGSKRDDEESDLGFRGKTALDRIAEAVRRNPFSVIMLEDIDEANMLLRGNIKRAMERGRLTDSHGREISLGNVIFILTADWMPDDMKLQSNGIPLDEKKLGSVVSGGWQLRLSLREKTAKRRANWLHDEDRANKPRKENGLGLSFDLNEAADTEYDKADGSRNSSDLTIEHEEEHGLNNRLLSHASSSVSREFLGSVDDAIAFKPVDFGPIKQNVANTITKRFTIIIGDRPSMEIDDDALEKIAGGVWVGRTSLEEWMEKVVGPSFHQLKLSIPARIPDECIIARLEPDNDSENRNSGDLLPGSIKVVVGL